VWLWAALLALNCSALLQTLGGSDTNGRAHGKRLRRELIGVPGRLVRRAAARARGASLRLPRPGPPAAARPARPAG